MALMLFTGCGTKKVINSVSDTEIKKQVEEEHFVFYSTGDDKECINDLSKELNNSYERITSDLSANIKDKVKIIIYPDTTSLHKAVGEEDLDDSFVGCAIGNQISMVSPLNPGKVHSSKSVNQVVVHEFVHVVVANISDDAENIPRWLDEGTAVYESKQLDDRKVTEYIIQKLSADSIPSLDELSNNFESTEGSYIYSYTIAKFYIEKYGVEKLKSSFSKPQEMYEITGVSKEEFEKEWKDYLKENYKGGLNLMGIIVVTVIAMVVTIITVEVLMHFRYKKWAREEEIDKLNKRIDELEAIIKKDNN